MTTQQARQSNEQAVAAWREERNAALRCLDMDYARRLMPYAPDDDVRLAALHKARYDCTDIEDALRHESAAWLRAQRMGAMNGRALLPPGQPPRGAE